MAKSERQKQVEHQQQQGVLDRIEQALEKAGEYGPLILQVVDKLVSVLQVRKGRTAGRARVGAAPNAFASPGTLDHPGLNELHRSLVENNLNALAASIECACCTDPDFAVEAPEGEEGEEGPQEAPEGEHAGKAPRKAASHAAAHQGHPEPEEATQTAAAARQRGRAGDQARAAQQEGQESVAVGGIQESTPEAAHAGNPTGGVPGMHPSDQDKPGKATEGSTPGQQEEPATGRRARRAAKEE